MIPCGHQNNKTLYNIAKGVRGKRDRPVLLPSSDQTPVMTCGIMRLPKELPQILEESGGERETAGLGP